MYITGWKLAINDRPDVASSQHTCNKHLIDRKPSANLKKETLNSADQQHKYNASGTESNKCRYACFSFKNMWK